MYRVVMLIVLRVTIATKIVSFSCAQLQCVIWLKTLMIQKCSILVDLIPVMNSECRSMLFVYTVQIYYS